MEEILRLMTSPGAGQVALGIVLAWIIVNQHLLKACYKENREAAEKCANENRKAFEKCADEQRKAARRYSAKNSAEHAEQLVALREIERKLDILLDRSNRPRTGSAAD